MAACDDMGDAQPLRATVTACRGDRCGVPVVTTPIGAEGMGWSAESGGGAAASDGPPETGAGGARHQPTAVADEAAWGGLVGWGEADFVDAAVRLYKQEVRTLLLGCRSIGDREKTVRRSAACYGWLWSVGSWHRTCGSRVAGTAARSSPSGLERLRRRGLSGQPLVACGRCETLEETTCRRA